MSDRSYDFITYIYMNKVNPFIGVITNYCMYACVFVYLCKKKLISLFLG